jgi:hypothetical protein
MHDRELHDLLLTLGTAAGAVLALPWALGASGVVPIAVRIALGAAIGFAVSLAVSLGASGRTPND